MKITAIIQFLFCYLLCVSSIISQEFTQIQHSIIIDGVLNDEEWQIIPQLPMTMSSPIFQGQMTEKTEIYIAYDTHYIYVGGRMYDSDMKNIQANSYQRDDWGSDESFGIIIDSFNDNLNALGFVSTPNAVRIDFQVFNDAVQGDPPFNMSWNAFWEAKSTRDEDAWYIEMKIPFSSLKFKSVNNMASMGILAFRYLVRKNEAHNFPAIDPKYNWGFIKPSIAQDIVLKNIHSSNPLYFTPYISTGKSLNNEFNGDSTQVIEKNEELVDLGFDIKLNLSEDLTLDLTLNPDFAQVESDNQVVNLSQYSLFQPEKRLFFQERSDLFNFGTGGPTTLFYTRRIGYTDSGSVHIYGGARLTGRMGQWDIGLLSMQTKSAYGFPSENFSVFRSKRKIINTNSTLGFIFTSKISENNQQNFGFGADSEIRLGESDRYFGIRFASSLDNDSLYKSAKFLEQSRAVIYLDSRSSIGFNSNVFALYSGEKYNPEMGYIRQENYYGFGSNNRYGSLFDENSDYYKFETSLFHYMSWNNTSQKFVNGDLDLSFKLESKKGSETRFKFSYTIEEIDEEIELPNKIIIPANLFYNSSYKISHNSPFGDRYRFNSSLEYENLFDGKVITAEIEPTLAINNFVTLNGGIVLSKGYFQQNDYLLILMNLSLKSSFNEHWSSSLFFQFNSDEKLLNFNFRLRYNPFEGSDFYLVLNENVNYDRYRLIRKSDLIKKTAYPLNNNFTFLLKYNYTFII